MERRKHARVQLPLLVELQLPSLGQARLASAERYIARDVSEGGVFVHLDLPPSIRTGAKLQLTLLNPSSVARLPTPTVEMDVTRVADNGLGLGFVNKTARHLWRSVEQLTDELAVGRDHFQVFLSAVVVNQRGQLLIVENLGKWSYPGEYLIVGEDWQPAIMGHLGAALGLSDLAVVRVLSANSGGTFDLPEAAVFKVYVLVSTNCSNLTSGGQGERKRYQNVRWIDNKREVEEVTFAAEGMPGLAHKALDWAQNRVEKS